MKSKIVFVMLGVVLASCGNKQQMPEASIDYAVSKVESADVDLNTSYPATIKGIQDIEIRPKVAGHITKVLVDEGDFVSAGQALFIIDQVQYDAAVKSARASVEVMKTNIATQELTLANKKMLLEKKIVSQYDYDIAANQLESLKAQLSQAQAALQNAEDNLKFCTVTSPASGVVGMIPYRVGSLVSSASAQPLTTVSNVSDVYAYFSMTEKQLLSLTKEKGGVVKAMDAMPAVKLVLADGSTYASEGKITAISGIIDQSTGAVQMRATFPNKGNVLRSGGTGSVLMPVVVESAIKVPQRATFDIQNLKFVFVLAADSTIAQREIKVLPQNDGQTFVLTSGLEAGETIVVEGVNQLRNGMKINPITPEQAEENVQAAKQALKDGKMPGEK